MLSPGHEETQSAGVFIFLIRIIMASFNPNNRENHTWDVNTNIINTNIIKNNTKIRKWLSGIQKVLISWLIVTWLAAALQFDEGIGEQTKTRRKAIEDTEINYANQTTKEEATVVAETQQKTWTYNGVAYTAKQLETAMETDRALKMAFRIAKQDDPSLQVWYDEGTNASKKINAQLEQSTAEYNKAKAEADKAEEANKIINWIKKKN